MAQSQETKQQLQNMQINRALGTFLVAFSLIVLFAILFTQTPIGRLTNLAAGAIIGLIGAIMLYHSRKPRSS